MRTLSRVQAALWRGYLRLLQRQLVIAYREYRVRVCRGLTHRRLRHLRGIRRRH